ncbi:MAG: hypothetical protein KIT84_20890 [Labilithrix sp.]|nr:hypothetical protein [Labilithrix sp.]MCW5813499.1 hypothetical protein [Labilithrix sp.]
MALLVACGDDAGLVLDVVDSGTDGTVADVNRPDAVGDVDVPDVDVPDADTPDVDVPDADAGVDDGGPTFFDAATFDAGPDAGFVPDSGGAAVQLGEVFCSTVARCCFGDATLQQGAPLPGGGTYNRQKCLNNYANNGFEQASNGSAVNPNHVIVSQTNSADCAQKLEALTCNVGFDEFKAVRAACYGALLGTQGPEQSCSVSAECQAGLFCNNPTNGNDTGKCELVRATGANCGDFTTNANTSQHACSYRYSGDPPRYCEWFDFTELKALPPAEWKCRDAKPNGSDCVSSAWCSAGICNFDTAKCETPTTYFTTDDCSQYRTP